MAVQRAWFLNFDADLELAAAPQAYTSPRWVVLRHHELTRRACGLVPEGDRVLVRSSVDERSGGVIAAPPSRSDDGPVMASEEEGRAFCPTPNAAQAWRAGGVAASPAPTVEVLRRVNHRQFAAELGPTLPGARFVVELDELVDALAGSAAADASPDWLLKRGFGFAGRGQRRLPSGVLDEPSRAFAAKALLRGEGLQVEPLVQRVLDVALHGFVTRRGALVLGEPTLQMIDAQGAWQGTLRAEPGALDTGEREQLLAEGERVGHALHGAGYFGPYGIDAFRWVARDGSVHFNARCEINARYTMGWAVGMGDRRPDLQPSASW